jgi:hypothetical protein
MSSIVATLICVIGIAGLFYLNRYDGPRASKALWIPAIWLFIISSRPVSFWLNADLFRSAAVTEPAQISDIASHEQTAYTAEGASPVRYQIAE